MVRVHVGTNKRIASGSEVGGKKFYPSLKAQLKYVLLEALFLRVPCRFRAHPGPRPT